MRVLLTSVWQQQTRNPQKKAKSLFHLIVVILSGEIAEKHHGAFVFLLCLFQTNTRLR